MKHIGIVVPCFPVISETFVRTEIKALIEAGHKVSVFTFIKNESSWQNVSVIEFTRTPQIFACFSLVAASANAIRAAYHIASQQQAISSVSLLNQGAKLCHLIKKLGVEHLHCHFMQSTVAYGLVAARLAGITISSIGHGHDVYVASADLHTKLQQCDFVVAVCKDMANDFDAMFCKQTRLLHCGVDTHRFKFHANPSNQTKRLLFVGRLVKQKGLEYALRALSDMPIKVRPQLDIIGTGPLLTELIELVRVLNLSAYVVFKGGKSSQQIIDMASQYDAFIAPFCITKSGEKDTGPVVLKEAMAMGLPVITCDVMGCREIVTNKVGYLVESRNVLALTRAIFDFCDAQEHQVNAMRIAARERVVRLFNAQSQAKKLSYWVEQVRYDSY